MKNLGHIGLYGALSALLALGCGGNAEGAPETPAVSEAEALAQQGNELQLALGPRGLAVDLSTQSEFTFGIAGDEKLVFVSKPLDRKVTVLNRFTGQHIIDVPAPSAGWGFPFKMRVPEPGHLVVLDPGGLPGPTLPIVRVYDIQYSYRHGQFQSSVTRTTSFENLPVLFLEDIEVLNDGTYVLSEPVIGSIWTISPGGAVAPAIFPLVPFDPAYAVPSLAACPFSGTLVVDSIPVTPAGGLVPGINPLAARGGNLYFASSCQGGIHKIPIASLFDPSRTPDQRAADISAVSPKAPGTQEVFEGIAFNPAQPSSPWLYVGDCFNLRLLRVNINTGARELVVGSSSLFNFPASLQFLPPVLGVSPLMVASDQEHRWASFNTSLTQDIFQPWIVTKVLPFD